MSDAISGNWERRAVLEGILQATARQTADESLAELAHLLAATFAVRCALLGEYQPNPAHTLQTRVVVMDGEQLGNIEIPTSGSPFASSLIGAEVFYTSAVRQKFPTADFLRSLSADGFGSLPVRDRHGEIVGHVAIIDDKPLPESPSAESLLELFAGQFALQLERSAMEVAADAHRHHLHDLIGWLSLTLLTMNAQGEITSCLGDAERLFGRTAEALVGKSLFDLLAPHKTWTTAIREALTARPPRTPVVAVRGRIERSMYLSFDQRHAELHVAFVDTNSAFGHSSWRLRLLGEVAAGVAHQLNQPLTAIANYADYVALSVGEDNPGDVQEALDQLSTQVSRASQVMRSLSRLRSSSHEQLVECHVEQLLRESLLAFDDQLGDRGISHAVTTESELPHLRLEQAQIQQVLANLISNAVEALTSASGPELRISAKELDGVTIAVHDNGHGMPPHVLQEAFSAFYTTKPDGTGIGLHISRLLVEGHGGRMWAESTVDQGTTIYFNLPRR